MNYLTIIAAIFHEITAITFLQFDVINNFRNATQSTARYVRLLFDIILAHDYFTAAVKHCRENARSGAKTKRVKMTEMAILVMGVHRHCDIYARKESEEMPRFEII